METRCGGREGARPVVQTIERMALWSSGQDLRAHTPLDVLEPYYPRLEDGAHRHYWPLRGFAGARWWLDQITIKVLIGQKIFRFYLEWCD